MSAWRWNLYRRYCAEIKWLLSQFDGQILQLRIIRKLLLKHDNKPQDGLKWFVLALAFIERAEHKDPASRRLERRALDVLLGAGIKPPKSHLSGLYADLFFARIGVVDHRQTVLLYQLLVNYCCPQAGINITSPVLPSLTRQIHPATTYHDPRRCIRQYRLSGRLDEAERECERWEAPEANYEWVLIALQKGWELGDVPEMPDHYREEMILISKLIRSRQWLFRRWDIRGLSSQARLLLDCLAEFYDYDQPLLKRLYHYVRMKESMVIDTLLYQLYFSGACLRWLFRSNQLDFARHEASHYMTLS